MRRALGIFHAVIALITGYWGLQTIFMPSSGGRFNWWPLIMLGAPILLFVGGVLTIFPQLKKIWLVALAVAILFVIWVTLIRDFSWTYWIFAAAVMLTTWGTLALASSLKRTETTAFIASLMLAASWFPGSIYAFRVYLFPNPPAANPPALLPLLFLLFLCGLIIASSTLSGIAFFRSSQV
jgi:hypothetical protein